MTVSEIEKIRKLKSLYDDFNRHHNFKPGDIVEYKPGLQTKLSDGPFIVIEILQKPVLLTKESPSTPYFRERLDIILGEITEGHAGEVLVFMHYDSRRFQPYGWTESEKRPVQ
ncbi:MAG: hypothetical protein NC112_02635 [Oxalobacter formigenes]|nr:hypothetical protein [Oxalobacter formigenes]